jgi:hypothetical protein
MSGVLVSGVRQMSSCTLICDRRNDGCREHFWSDMSFHTRHRENASPQFLSNQKMGRRTGRTGHQPHQVSQYQNCSIESGVHDPLHYQSYVPAASPYLRSSGLLSFQSQSIQFASVSPLLKCNTHFGIYRFDLKLDRIQFRRSLQISQARNI